MSNDEIGAFHFQVDLGDGGRRSFAEVSGLGAEVTIIEYRNGDEPVYSPRKLPGPARYGNVTLKRGSLPADDQLWSWIDAAIQGSPEPRDVTVLLLNTDHEPVRAWRLRNAWPAAYEVSRFDAKAAKIAIESLELAHEGLALLDL